LADTFEFVLIPLGDLEDIRHTLRACLNLTAAKDIEVAQLALSNTRPSALYQEIERLSERVAGLLGDHYLALKDAEFEDEQEEGTEEDEDSVEGAEDGSESDTEASTEDEEPLPEAPPFAFKAPAQTGRRISREEARLASSAADPEPTGETSSED